MNAVLLLSCFLSASQISGELLFIPSTTKAEQANVQIPGILVNTKDVITVLADENADPSSPQEPLGNVQARGILGGRPRQDDNPIAAFQTDPFKKASAPMCLACTCREGRTSCKDAGGVAFLANNEVIGGINVPPRVCSTAAPCVMEALDTMSSCDTACKRRTATCTPNLAPQTILSCTENVNRALCNTDCELRTPGDKVLCSQQAIARGVIKDIPKDICSVFTGRKRRDTGPEQRNTGFLANSFLGRFIPIPASTIRIPGAAVLAYAPTGSCLQQEIANAPLCTRLD